MTFHRIAMGLFLSVATPALAEDITLTTFYPSPRGVYEELRTTNNTLLAMQAGRVGIGTNNPADPAVKLHVFGSGTGADIARIAVTSTDNQAGISFLSDASGEAVVYSPTGTDDLRLLVGGADRVSVTSGGNVGIGTTTPTNRLTVAGEGSIGVGYLGISAPTNGLIVEGSVGINVTAPASQLQVVRNAGEAIWGATLSGVGVRATSLNGTALTAADAAGGNAITANVAGPGGTAVWAGVGSASSNAGLFQGRVRIEPGGGGALGELLVTDGVVLATVSGSVGVGTAAPATKLDVIGGVKVGDEPTCDGARAGTIRWNPATPAMEYCDGTSWQEFVKVTPPIPACTSPGFQTFNVDCKCSANGSLIWEGQETCECDVASGTWINCTSTCVSNSPPLAAVCPGCPLLGC